MGSVYAWAALFCPYGNGHWRELASNIACKVLYGAAREDFRGARFALRSRDAVLGPIDCTSAAIPGTARG
jgi:hypothetical protein